MSHHEIPVQAGGGALNYPVRIGAGIRAGLVDLLRERAPGVDRWAVITDSNVAPVVGSDIGGQLAAAGLDGITLTVPAGEANKTRAQWEALTDALLDAGYGRDCGVVAVGGGVIGDLAGFVASTFMRGIPVVQMPTSLLAMIDASVGGKTGVDTSSGKNLVGAFHPPRAVVIDPEVLASLPRVERSMGLAEAVKHGAILDADYGAAIAKAGPALLDADPAAIEPVVRRSVELKAEVVSRDEREGGLREILNFGHTIGHALEHASSFETPHGAAVARGMLWEVRIGVELGITAPETLDGLAGWLAAAELPAEPGPLDPDQTADAVLLDKKTRSGSPRFVLLERLGSVARSGEGYSHPIAPDDLRTLLHRLAG